MIESFPLAQLKNNSSPFAKFFKSSRTKFSKSIQRKVSFSEESYLLGYVVSRQRIQVDPVKVFTVNKCPEPKKATAVRSFLGLCSYNGRNVKDFAKMARLLHQLTETSKDFLWNTEAQGAFAVLKARLTSALIFLFPKHDRIFHILY